MSKSEICMSLFNIATQLFYTWFNCFDWERWDFAHKHHWVSNSIIFFPISVVIKMVGTFMFCQEHYEQSCDKPKTNSYSHSDTSWGKFKGRIRELREVEYLPISSVDNYCSPHCSPCWSNQSLNTEQCKWNGDYNFFAQRMLSLKIIGNSLYNACYAANKHCPYWVCDVETCWSHCNGTCDWPMSHISHHKFFIQEVGESSCQNSAAGQTIKNRNGDYVNCSTGEIDCFNWRVHNEKGEENPQKYGSSHCETSWKKSSCVSQMLFSRFACITFSRSK